MATPAAILSILVTAETTKATASLRTFDKTVARTGNSSRTTSKYTSDLDRKTKNLGNQFRSAAGYAASAAAAYLSISQAKAAITTTQELSNTSFNLSRNLGLTTKAASRWASVAKTRDISTQQLSTSFTTLTKQLTAAKKGTAASVAAFEALGISQRDLKRDGDSFNKQLLTVADALEDVKGSAERQAAATTLLGRGYQNLIPIMGQGSEKLREQLELGDKYGSTMGKDAVLAQQKFGAEIRESERAWQGMQVTFTKFLTPALEKANEEFQKISAILADDNLTDAARFKKIGDIVSGWADKAFDAFIKVLPKMAEAAGEQAPKIALALAKGFMNADIWGKVFLGGWLFAKMGGKGFFTGQGKMAGRLFAGGFLLALPTLITEAYDLGKKIGHAIEDVLGTGPKFEPNFSAAIKGAGTAATALPDAVVHGNQEGFKGSGLLDTFLKNEKERAKAIEKAREKSAKRQQAIEFDNAVEIDSILQTGFGNHLDTTQGGLRRQERAFGDTRGKLNNTTKGQTQDVAGNVARMVNAVGDGLKKLGSNTNNALKAFGAKKIAFSIASVGDAAGDVLPKQRGGPIDIGAPSGDSVKALLEKGEYVLNRRAVAAVGKDKLDAINFNAAPRFATGGSIGSTYADMVSGWNQNKWGVAGGYASSAEDLWSKLHGGWDNSAFLAHLAGTEGDWWSGLDPDGYYTPGANYAISGMAGYDYLHPGGALTGDVYIDPGAPLEGEAYYYGWGKKGLGSKGFGAYGGRHAGVMKQVGGLIGKIGKYATGGLIQALGPYSIPPIQYDANHAGGNSHWHINMSTTPAVVALGKRLQGMGFNVSEHPAFGGVNYQHSATGGHYDALSIDVNSAADETREETAAVAALLSGKGGAFTGKMPNLKKMLLNGPAGPLKDMGQGSLNKAYDAAKKFLASKMPSVTGGYSGSAGGAFDKGELVDLWTQVNKGAGNANTMAAIALAESSGNPSANGPPDGRGLWQIEWPIWGSTLGKYGNPYDPAANARMARAVLDQQGLGAWVVYNTGAYSQFLQKGGLAQKMAAQMPPYAGEFARGGVVPGPIGRPAMATVHGGETITPHGAAPNVNVHVDVRDTHVDVTTEIDGKLADQTRTARQLSRMYR